MASVIVTDSTDQGGQLHNLASNTMQPVLVRQSVQVAQYFRTHMLRRKPGALPAVLLLIALHSERVESPVLRARAQPREPL